MTRPAGLTAAAAGLTAAPPGSRAEAYAVGPTKTRNQTTTFGNSSRSWLVRLYGTVPYLEIGSSLGSMSGWPQAWFSNCLW
jgi:hypothetical protein